MKSTNAALCVLSTLVLVAGVAGNIATLEALNSFREPRNIAFSAMMGGSSPIVWVLSVLNELSDNRGHTTYFFTKEDQTRFGDNYPSINTISVGPKENFSQERAELLRNIREMSIIESCGKIVNTLSNEFEKDYIVLLEHFKFKQIDLAICDNFNAACAEASTTLKIPFIITSSIALSPDAGASYINNNLITMKDPTTVDLSLWERFDNLVAKPIQLVYTMRHFIKKQRALYKSLGITHPLGPPELLWENSLKMFNTAFGFEPARPLGPLVEFVGPIVVTPTAAPPLTSELSEFLETHNKVAYIAFGQLAIASTHDLKLLMTGLLEAYEKQAIDGIIWATRGLENVFPDFLTTESNTTYNVQSFFKENNKNNVKFVNWAPQIAILNHPSTSMFITHGGAGSMYESMNAGVRVVVFPFFGNQPGGAKIAEKNGVGLYLHFKATQQKATEIIQRVAKDDDNYFQNNVNRFKAIVQLNSKLGTARAANLVEEVLFTHQNGQLLHRRDVKRDMSFIKAYNLDIYAIILVVALTIMLNLANVIRKAIMSYYTSLNQKIKTA